MSSGDSADVSVETIDTTPACDAKPTPGQVEQPLRRWPAPLALLTAGVLPATTAQRTQHVSLFHAFVIHIEALLIGAVCLLVVIGAEYAAEGNSPTYWEGIQDVSADFIGEFEQHPGESWLATGAIVIAIEGTLVFLAILLAPWGARDESIRASVASSFRRTWLHTSQLWLLVLVVGGLSIALAHAYERWEGTWSDWQSLPWYVRYYEAIVVYFVIAAWLLFVLGLMRAIGAPRRVASVERPPTCLCCGYNLSKTGIDGRCPECGEAVAASLISDPAPHARWEARAFGRNLLVWWRCGIDVLVRPLSFGRRLQPRTNRLDHRRFLRFAIPLVFAAGYIGVLVVFFSDMGGRPLREYLEFALFVAPYFGVVTMLTSLAILFLSGWLVALYLRSGESKTG